MQFQFGGKRNQVGNAAWAVLISNRNLLMFPLVAMIITAVISIVGYALVAGTGLLNPLFLRDTKMSVSFGAVLATVLFLVVYLFITKMLVVYSNAVVVAEAFSQDRGEASTVANGIQTANKHLFALFLYALLSAIVGVIAGSVGGGSRSRSGLSVGGLNLSGGIGSLIGAAWGTVTFLVIPVIIAENVSIIGGLERSFDLFQKTWGENIVGQLQLGLNACLVSLGAIVPGILLAVLGYAIKAQFVFGLGIVVLMTGIGAFRLLNNAVSAVFQAELYTYAADNGSTDLLDSQLVGSAFS